MNRDRPSELSPADAVPAEIWAKIAFLTGDARVETGLRRLNRTTWQNRGIPPRGLLLPPVSDADPSTDQVVAARFSSDGRVLMTLSRGGRLRSWDLRCGQDQSERRTLPLGEGVNLFQASFSGDGRLVSVVTGSLSEPLRVSVFDLSASPIAPVFVDDVTGTRAGRVCSVGLSSSGTYLAITLSDRSLRVWNVQQGCSVALPRVFKLSGSSGFSAFEFTPDERAMVCLRHNRERIGWRIYEWDLRETVTLVTEVPGLLSSNTLAVSPDGATVATAYSLDRSDYRLGLWSRVPSRRGSMTTLRTGLRAPECGIALRAPECGIAFLPDGARLVAWTHDAARVLDLETGESVFTTPIQRSVTLMDGFLHCSPDNRHLASTSTSGPGALLHRAPAIASRSGGPEQNAAGVRALAEPEAWPECEVVATAAPSSDGFQSRRVTLSRGGLLRTWNLLDGQEQPLERRQVLPRDLGPLSRSRAAISQDGRIVAAVVRRADLAARVVVLNVAPPTPIVVFDRRLPGLPEGHGVSVALSSQGTYLRVSFLRGLHIWNVPEARSIEAPPELFRVAGARGSIWEYRFAPDESGLVACTSQTRPGVSRFLMKAWDLHQTVSGVAEQAGWVRPESLAASSEKVAALFSPQPHGRLGLGIWTREPNRWSMRPFSVENASGGLGLHQAHVEFSPDGTRFAIAPPNRAISVLDVTTGAWLAVTRTQATPRPVGSWLALKDLVWSSDGRHVVWNRGCAGLEVYAVDPSP